MLPPLLSLVTVTASVPEAVKIGQADTGLFGDVFSALMDATPQPEAALAEPVAMFAETAANIDQPPEGAVDLADDAWPEVTDNPEADSPLPVQLAALLPDSVKEKSGASVSAGDLDEPAPFVQRFVLRQMTANQGDMSPTPPPHPPQILPPQHHAPQSFAVMPVRAGPSVKEPDQVMPVDSNPRPEEMVADIALRRPDHTGSLIKLPVTAPTPVIDDGQVKVRLADGEKLQIKARDPVEEVAPRPPGAKGQPEPRSTLAELGLRAQDYGRLVPDLLTNGESLPVSILSEKPTPVLHVTSPSGVVLPETPRMMAQQIAVAVTQTAGQPTEIALNPEELGRVRMQIVAGDGAVMVQILAERPETTDLLRRHIETLAQEFRTLGFSDIAFSFGNGRPRDPDTGQITGAQPPAPDELTVTDQPAAPPRPARGSLDLRL
ncbi:MULTISPECIES: flagellar hook-length control protein FliK [unclassified Yoonia]|uniref:flagellar hook-length control protein FliK n=1 Tax=unclassified Yoonia TaxID=2629118 RepID=UPI002AFFF1D0|nr:MULTISPECIES: flagellar hook-length control protein FliK [unclassified Yoonia]